MEDLLKYVSLISVAGAGISFVAGLWKYLDQRAREDRTRRFELYHDLMRRVSAQGESEDATIPLTQQVAAIYELQHFAEYSYASVPILEHLRERFSELDAPPVVVSAVDRTVRALER